MSENYDSKLVSQDSGAVENGDSNDSRTPPVCDDVEPAGQEPSSLQVDGVDHSNGVLLTGDDSAENGPSDVGATDDGGKEDMFVDCPDELIVSDNREAMAVPDTQQRLEENDDMQDTRVHESANGTQVHAGYICRLCWRKSLLRKKALHGNTRKKGMPS